MVQSLGGKGGGVLRSERKSGEKRKAVPGGRRERNIVPFRY